MDCIRAPSIRVCSRGVIADLRGSAGRPLVSYDSGDEAEVTRTQEHQKMRFSVEDDLNWTSKYLNIDRVSGTPGTRRSGGVSPVRVPSPAATGKYFGSAHSQDSGLFGSRSSTGEGGGRSKSPSTFSENSEDGVSRGGAINRHKIHQHNGPLNFRAGGSSSILHGSQNATTRNGYLNLGDDVSGSIRATSPSMSRPVTRTYDDLQMSRPPSTSPSYAAFNSMARPAADTRTLGGGFDVSISGARFHSNAGGSGSGVRIAKDSSSRSESNNTKITKRPVSDTRKKLRSLLCRTRNDPRYFDDDF